MIGWYVHAHGSGHLHRQQAIARHLREPVTALSSLPAPSLCVGQWLQLPEDLPTGADVDVTAGGTLHWAPCGHPGLRARMAAIAAWVEQARPTVFVVDVSVEVSLLVRSMGVPVVVAAMRGDRGDRPHTTAYDLAAALLAPWPAELAEPWPDPWHDKAWHVGALSRFDDRPVRRPPDRRRVAVLWGGGGSDTRAVDLLDAQRATPGWTWEIAGAPGAPWVEDTWEMLQRADVVVTHAGQNALAEVAAARRPAIVLPQPRPHGEQFATGRALATAGLALVRETWPGAGSWPGLLEQAAGLDGSRWSLWSDGHGAARAARRLEELAACAPQ